MKFLLLSILLYFSISHLNAKEIRADVTNVQVSGKEHNYKFSVTISSDETGCNQYASWWEILYADGSLVHRRILIHSHPDTQPFTRSGYAVNVSKGATLYIRAHMNRLGYVGDVFSGSIENGFKKARSVPEFPKSLEYARPLPNGCAY